MHLHPPLQVSGLPTNTEFLKRITQNEEFQQGAVDTSFIAKHEGQLLSAEPVGSSVLALAAVTFMQAAVQRAQQASQVPCGRGRATGL